MSFSIPNTLSLPAEAYAGGIVRSLEDLLQHLRKARSLDLPVRAIGSGSNIVPHRRVAQYVCAMRNRGIRVVAESGTEITIEVAAGEIWHDFVCFSSAQGWFGLENLALIPGTVGAAPIQNIGAYGVELATFIDSVLVVNAEGETWRLDHGECEFAYRHSVLKLHQEWIVVSVRLQLPKAFVPVISYPDLQQAFSGGASVTPDQLIDAVVSIRTSKLPDPARVPNAGSFFKNPVVTPDQARALADVVDNLLTYPDPNGVKLSGAQLIDDAGWKERAHKTVACWPKQALVLVNRGNASTPEVLAFATAVQNDIRARYGVQLELEPSLLF